MVYGNPKRKSGMVKLREGFSDRNAIVEFNKIQQIDEFDDVTRVRLGNTVLILLDDCLLDNFENYFGPVKHRDDVNNRFCKEILSDLFCERTAPYGYSFYWRDIFTDKIEPVILNATYNEVLDTLEYCCRWFVNESKKDWLYKYFNTFFEKEYVGYRFLEGFIVPITDEVELKEIAEACNNPYDGTRGHMRKAVQYLADRETKDYKNCIEESMHAVESICKIITGNEKAVLSDALKEMEKNKGIHPSLKLGFIKLYAYISDKGGIRHADGLFESNVSFDEAKYFLVSCSAFVNYLIAEYATGSN